MKTAIHRKCKLKASKQTKNMRKQALIKLFTGAVTVLVIFIVSINYYVSTRTNAEESALAHGTSGNDNWDAHDDKLLSHGNGDTKNIHTSTLHPGSSTHSKGTDVKPTGQADEPEKQMEDSKEEDNEKENTKQEESKEETQNQKTNDESSTKENEKEATEETKDTPENGNSKATTTSSESSSSTDAVHPSENGVPPAYEYFEKFFDILNQAGPDCPELNDYNRDECPMKGSVAYWGEQDYDRWKWLSYQGLMKCLKVDKSSFKDLHKKHQYFMNHFTKLHEQHEKELLNSGTYKGNGIVVVGGGKYSVLSFLLIKAIKEQNINLPVEVLIPPAEMSMEKEYCSFLEENSYEYNAKCIYFDRVFPPALLEKFEFKGYQYKSVALLASSFENVLLIDADNVPVTDISNVFESEVFQKIGMIMWPDYWRRTTNPKYYQIADLNINFKNRTSNLVDFFTPSKVYTPHDKLDDLEFMQNELPYHEFDGAIPDTSSESGQLLINKKTHMKSILLSFYYNVYGPKHYYPLFSQHASGQGDKETFIAAAHVLNEPYYQVKSTSGVEGYHKKDKSGFRGIAIYQKNFIQDYALFEISKRKIYEKYSLTGTEPKKTDFEFDPEYSPFKSYLHLYFNNKDTAAENMFAHCNLPKFDPAEMAAKNEYTWEGEHFRVFNKKKTNGFDLEKSFFNTFNDHLCQDDDNYIPFSFLKNKLQDDAQWDEMCTYIDKRLEFLKENPEKIV